jgi:trk system potassium uptake protein TrkH
LIFAISAFLITVLENNFLIGVTGSISTIGNVGPAFAKLGPLGSFDLLHPVSKLICISNMIVGRLELIPFLAMLHPDFWNFRRV